MFVSSSIFKNNESFLREGHDVVDLSIYSSILKNNESFLGEGHAEVLDCSLNLKAVMKELESIKNDMMPEKWRHWLQRLINNNTIQQLVKKEMMQSASPQAAGTSTSGYQAGRNPSAIEHEEVIVGFDEDARLIIDRLAGDHKQLDIISIVGMGGLGKTTLATKIFNDPYVVYYFQVRGWTTISRTYKTQDLLIEILASIEKSNRQATDDLKGKSNREATSDPKLREMLHKSLKGRRYFIVIDDIWSAKAWQDLRRYFPDDSNGSRVLLTTRLAEVAVRAIPGGFTHNLRYLTKEKSWELLRKKTFRGDEECPESLIKIGKHIAKKCQGLPLALVVIAGLLEKGERSKEFWEKVAESVGSYIVNDHQGCFDTLALSYDHLPRHLKNCFLYAGGFPEDYKFNVRRLIWTWMAEGLIKKAGHKSLEEEGEDYLMDLVDRNLLIVVDRASLGGIKSCRLHDLLRELCLKKATEENFFKKIDMSKHNPLSDSTSNIDKQHRLFVDFKDICERSSYHRATRIRSVLCFSNRQRLLFKIVRWVPTFLLLRVLDLQDIITDSRGHMGIQFLIHLRYLAVCCRFPFSVSKLRGLQTYILKGCGVTFSPVDMANMVNLRHLWSDATIVIHPIFPVLFNLQTISKLRLNREGEILLRSLPNIKKLGCSIARKLGNHMILNFALLTHLQSLMMQGVIARHVVSSITFPETLKKLTLRSCRLPWTYMSNIQRLPKLEVLKLLRSSFVGPHWDTRDQQYPQLKYLKLQGLNFQSWEATSVNFPRLQKLVVDECVSLKKIPQEIGDIFTLKVIDIINVDKQNNSLVDSVNEIQQEQHEMGNDELKISVSHAPELCTIL